MPFFAFAFFCGDIYLQTFAKLPSFFYCGVLLLAAFLLLLIRKINSHWRLLVFSFVLGFTYTAIYAHHVLRWELPAQLESKPISVTGYIVSLPEVENEQIQFYYRLVPDNVLIRLTWRNMLSQVKVGEKWQFKVRLKRIHGVQNPGGFDFEAWALQKGLRATGYVVESDQNRLLAYQWYREPINRLRQIMRDKIVENLPHTATSHWLLALTLGERSESTKEEWQILRRTGTNHLMAIAGLHIGLLISVIYFLWKTILYCVPLNFVTFFTRFKLSLLLFITVIFYSAMAGFSLPTERACLMFGIFTLFHLSKRESSGWQIGSLALLLVLICNPLSVLEQSFWLSFGTIALIIYGMQSRLYPRGWWWKWFRVQYVIGVGLLPFSILFFQQASLISFLANSVAIPWLGILILPFCFLAELTLFIAPKISAGLFWIADNNLYYLWQCLIWFSHLPLATWYHTMPNFSILLTTLLGFLLFLLPRHTPGKLLCVIWILPLLSYQVKKPNMNDYWLTLLDVGQGLSAVIETNQHILVFDTGLQFKNMDMGESVLVPYLRTRGINTVDMLVVSHGDNDHIGGVNALLNSLAVNSIKTTATEKIPGSQYCLAGMKWNWDGVSFEFIYPDQANLNLGNDSSCVLRIDNGKKRLLLTGDIEKYAEKQLLKNNYALLSADMIIAPHHGSKTSGLPEFINAVHPESVLYATGYRNRYHFPHQNVINTYKLLQAKQFNTAYTGTIIIKVNSFPSMQIYRHLNSHYW